jgi:hypothetical protein
MSAFNRIGRYWLDNGKNYVGHGKLGRGGPWGPMDYGKSSTL